MSKFVLMLGVTTLLALGIDHATHLSGQEAFYQVIRREAVDIHQEYDLAGLSIP